MVREYKEKLEGGEELMKRLGVDPTDPNSWPPTPAEMLAKDKRKLTRFIQNVQKRLNLAESKAYIRVISVPIGYSLQEKFEEWSGNTDTFAAILFKNIETAHDVKQLLSPWKIQYGGKRFVDGICTVEMCVLTPFLFPVVST